MPQTSTRASRPVSIRLGPGQEADSIERHHLREIELFISGAVTFALLQVPPYVDRAFYQLSLRLDATAHQLLAMGYLYAKMILYTLIAVLLLHLVGRAYMVGLVGLREVYPRGVRWRDFTGGPIGERVYRARRVTLRTQIRRADSFCNVLFSVGFLLISFCVFVTVMLVPVTLIGWAVQTWVAPELSTTTVLYLVLLVVLGPSMVVGLADKQWGERIRRGSPRLARAMRRVLTGYYLLVGGPVWVQLYNVLSTNIPKKRFYPTAFAVFVLLFGLVTVKDLMMGWNGMELSAQHFLPGEVEQGSVRPIHYADQRTEHQFLTSHAPFIQTDVFGPEDRFVELFLPYFPLRHNEVVPELCPEVEPAGPQRIGLRDLDGDPVPAERMRGLVACMMDLQPVRLNGEPVPPSRFELATDPRSGVRGLKAYLPVTALPEGRNLLRVEGLARLPDDERDPRDPALIPFWVAH